MALGAADDPQLTSQVSGVLAAELLAVGVNWNLAPAIDVTHDIHDAGIITADTLILTMGDSEPSLRAAADALIGDYKPAGRINVPLRM